jgi:chromosome segregation ATPase
VGRDVVTPVSNLHPLALLDTKIYSIRDEYTRNEHQRTVLERRMESLERRNASLERRYSRLERRNESLLDRIDSLEEQVEVGDERLKAATTDWDKESHENEVWHEEMSAIMQLGKDKMNERPFRRRQSREPQGNPKRRRVE